MGHTSHVKHVNEVTVDLHGDALWDIPQSQCLPPGQTEKKDKAISPKTEPTFS